MIGLEFNPLRTDNHNKVLEWFHMFTCVSAIHTVTRVGLESTVTVISPSSGVEFITQFIRGKTALENVHERFISFLILGVRE